MDPVVVGDVEADRVRDQGVGDPERLHPGAAAHVAGDQGEPTEVAAEDAAPRDVLAEGHRVPLGVAVAGAGTGCPHDALVQHVLRAGVDHRPDQDRPLHGVARLVDRGVDSGVGEGVDRRGVLRPQHEVRLRLLTGGHVVGEPDGRVHVVAGHLPVVEQDVVTGAGDVALDDGHRSRAVAGDVVRRQGGDQAHAEHDHGRDRREDSGSAGGDDDLREQAAEEGEQEAEAALADVGQG